MSFTFIMICPRCNKTSPVEWHVREPDPHVSCGDCLMDDLEVVRMKVANVVEDAETHDGMGNRLDGLSEEDGAIVDAAKAPQ